MAVMCEFVVSVRLLASVCMKAMFIILWFSLVLKLVMMVFKVVMCELMVLVWLVFMLPKLAIAVMCAVVVRPIASFAVDKNLYL